MNTFKMREDMLENRADIHFSKENIIQKIGHLLSVKIRPSAIYFSPFAITAAAMLGIGALDLHIARAVDVSQPAMQQKLLSFSALVERVKAAVVSIHVKAEEAAALGSDRSAGTPANPFEGTPFERFFKAPHSPFKRAPGGHRVVTGQGSGFFISPDGYIVTNNHVANRAVSLEIVTDDGKIYPAKVVGTDPGTDLALLKAGSRNDFPYVKFSHFEVRVGDWVVAMGNPFGLGGTVTAGIVSARMRNIGEGPYDDFLQIDAPINRGNSGGRPSTRMGKWPV